MRKATGLEDFKSSQQFLHTGIQLLLADLAGAAIGHIVPNGPREQGPVLGHQGEGAPPGHGIDLPGVSLTKLDHSAVRLVQPLQQLEEGGLAGPVAADDGSPPCAGCRWSPPPWR